MNFGEALEAIKSGARVARSGWNGKGMFLFLVPGSTFAVNRPPLLGSYPEGTPINYRPHIDMKTADGEIVPWVASQSDLLCDDWQMVEASQSLPEPTADEPVIIEDATHDIDRDGPPLFRS